MDAVCLRNLALSFFTLIALAVGALSANAPAPAPMTVPDCSEMVLQLADCLSYVSAQNTTSKPSISCCNGLKEVLKTAGVAAGGHCLCETFKGSMKSGMSLNMDNSNALPDACKVTTFSVKNCSLGPAAAPVPAFSPSPISLSPSGAVNPPSTVNPPNAGTGTNEIAPAPGPGSSTSSSSMRMASVELLVITIVIAVFYTSSF